MSDTTDEIFLIQARVFHQMSPQQRFQLGLQMIADGCLILENRLRRQMPDSPDSERMAKRFEQLYQHDLSPNDLAACLEGLKHYWQQRTDSDKNPGSE
jgi:hypothetical protein